MTTQTTETTFEAPIQEGDAAVVIKRDGAVHSFSFGVNQKLVQSAASKFPEQMTSEELDVSLQGQTLFLLHMAASNEPVMTFLSKLAAMDGDIDLAKIQRAAQLH